MAEATWMDPLSKMGHWKDSFLVGINLGAAWWRQNWKDSRR